MTSLQKKAYGSGLLIAVLAGVFLLFPGYEDWHTPGPINVGHSKINCIECHTLETGNFVSQALNNILYAVGWVSSATSFVFKPVRNEQCLNCHENPEDRHPVADFTASEFIEARQAIGVQTCMGCHREHLGVRVSVTAQVCQYCHEETTLEDDPLDVAHPTLIRDKRWETCLGCHDFHGNHEYDVPTALSEILSEEKIQQYLDGGKSPYGYRRLTVIQTMRNKQ